ncbi:MAG TPA: lipoate--protein ligase [Acholeplasmataceae bacterium]|nr:lipoate--protein ligase [Acholeplasmataceae bacterium]
MTLIKHHNLGQLKPYFYFALEEYAMQTLLKEHESFFFTWEIEGVVVGKNQLIENEVNLAYCREQNIDIYRRPTGGGCVYADERNTMFSMVTSKKNTSFSFKTYLTKIIDAMEALGVHIEFSGRNDLLYDGKKISGNAFLQNKYGMLMHGTFLYDCDLETMVRAISPSDEKLISKGIESVRSRVTNMKSFLNGRSQKELIKHFENYITTDVYELTEDDIEKIQALSLKFQDKSYIYRKQPAHTKVLKQRIPGGLFELVLNIQQGKIQKLQIQGDFFDINPLDTFEVKFDGIDYTSEAIENILKDINIKDYVLDADNESFKALLISGIIE